MKLIEHGSVIIDDIEIGHRLRDLDPVAAEALAGMIRESELQHPVQLLKDQNRLRLASGRHRIEAFRILGREAIPAMVWECAENENPDDALRMLEITENVGRRELDALDRAAHVHELMTLYKRAHGETRGAKKGKSANIALFNLSDDVASRVGLSRRSIFADAELYQKLAPVVRKALAGSEYAKNRAQLIALATLNVNDQKRALDAVLRTESPAPNIKSAIALVTNNIDTSSPDERAFARFIKLWASGSAKLRRQIRAHIEKEAV